MEPRPRRRERATSQRGSLRTAWPQASPVAGPSQCGAVPHGFTRDLWPSNTASSPSNSIWERAPQQTRIDGGNSDSAAGVEVAGGGSNSFRVSGIMITNRRSRVLPMRGSLTVVLSGVVSAILMWTLAGLGASNLKAAQRPLVEIILVIIAGVGGMVVGAVIVRRRRQSHAALFGFTVGAIFGAVCGSSYFLVMGLAYVATFGGSPVSLTDGLVIAVSFPVFAALGALVGSLPGSALGAGGAFIVTRLR